MRALISVYDKSKISEFARGLSERGYEIISTGGSLKVLRESGIDVLDITEVTKFPEMFDGRVKTLHPNIHAGILCRRDIDEDLKAMENLDIKSIDIVVNNLYPFKEKLKMKASHAEMIENIDIGGPSMLRAAAKNYKDVLIVTDPLDYGEVLSELDRGVSTEFREKLAAKAFSISADYDLCISKYLNERFGYVDENLNLNYSDKKKLRYGENPHQDAYFYRDANSDFKYEILQGKELSYNNYCDITAAIRTNCEFDEPCAVNIKHQNPCAIAIGRDIYDAYVKAYEADSESVFGGIIALNRRVEGDLAKKLCEIFLEVIIAPEYSDEALEIFKQKKNLRIMCCDFKKLPKKNIKEVLGGILIQDADLADFENLNFVSELKPSAEELEELKFAYRAIKHCASNAVCITKDKVTLGIGQGQTKRAWAAGEAIERAGEVEGAVLASDGFFFVDTLELMLKHNIKLAISPGGSIRDDEVIKFADENNIALVFTGMRHFRH